MLCNILSHAQVPADAVRARALYDSLNTVATTATGLASATKPPDSMKYRAADELRRVATRQKIVLDSIIKRSGSLSGGTVPDFKKDTAKACNCVPVYNQEWGERGGWLLVFMPMIIFLGMMLFVLIRLRGFMISDALRENSSTKVTIINPEYTAANIGSSPLPAAPLTPATIVNLATLIPPTIDVTPFKVVPDPANPAGAAIKNPALEYRPSISRFIALLSTLIIITIVVSMSCLFIYRYVAYGCPPDLSGLTAILLALGVGIVPYAVNKVANAANSDDKTI